MLLRINLDRLWKRVGLTVLVVALCVLWINPALSITSRSSYWGTAARGMGGAFTAAGGNFSGISYNPANSATIQSGQFVSDFNQLSQRAVTVQNGAVGAAYRWGNWVHGVAINRTDLSFDFGNFNVTSDGLELNYTDDIFYYNTAWNITKNAHLATNLKYFKVSTSVEDGNASGYGLDLGYMHYIGKRTTLGLSLKNLVGSKDWESGVSEDVPMDARLGLRYRFFSDASAEFDVVYGEEPGLQSINIGGEWWVWRRFQQEGTSLRRPYFRYMQRQANDRIQFGLAFRGGLEQEMAGSEDTNFSLGLGMQFGSGHLDYSFQQRSGFDNQHYFGFSTSFGGNDNASAVSGTQSDRTTRRSTRSSSFVGKPLDVGLLQWQSEPGIRMATDRLESNLSKQSGINISVYNRNTQIEQSLIEDSLSNYQKNRLLEKTGQDYLVTGVLRYQGRKYQARVVIESKDNRKVMQISAGNGSTLITRVSERIRQYIQRNRQQVSKPRKSSGRKTLQVPYSVRIGLLQWNIDNNVNFKAKKLQRELERSKTIRSTVYKRNRQLEQSLLHNALTPKQTDKLLKNAGKDYLVTGRITKLKNGYLATAYLVNGEKRRSLNVMHSNLGKLVDRLSKQIRNRVSS